MALNKGAILRAAKRRAGRMKKYKGKYIGPDKYKGLVQPGDKKHKGKYYGREKYKGSVAAARADVKSPAPRDGVMRPGKPVKQPNVPVKRKGPVHPGLEHMPRLVNGPKPPVKAQPIGTPTKAPIYKSPTLPIKKPVTTQPVGSPVRTFIKKKPVSTGYHMM